MTAPVVEWRCDATDACLVAAVYAGAAGPTVRFKRHRVSPAVAEKVGRDDRTAGPAGEVLLADLHRRGVVGPLNCRHHVWVSVATADLQDDYDQAVAEHRQVRRLLRP